VSKLAGKKIGKKFVGEAGEGGIIGIETEDSASLNFQFNPFPQANLSRVSGRPHIVQSSPPMMCRKR
jgi:hypothetical protein